MSFLQLPARAALALALIGGIETHVFRATMGQRVTFVKRVDLPVDVEFGVDPSQHQVVQTPGTGLR